MPACPEWDWGRVLNSDTPLSNAVVAKPARSKCAPWRWRSRTPSRPNALFKIHATEAGFRAAFARFRPAKPCERPAPRNVSLAKPWLEGTNRAGAFRRRHVFGLAASGDLDFPALPLLVGLRLGQRDGDPASARVPLKVFEADFGQFRPAQASREPDQEPWVYCSRVRR
jgi:hypothetical protein